MSELPGWLMVLIMFGVPAAALTAVYLLGVFVVALFLDWRRHGW